MSSTNRNLSGTAPSISVRRGAVYLPAAVADTYFKGIEAVIMLIREGELLVMPVHQMGSGGCLLKRRNAAGDRVASAPDVFEANGFGDLAADELAGGWSSKAGAFRITLPKTEN